MWVASSVRWASTDWYVTFGFTNGIPATRLGIAGVQALVFNAGVVIWALIIILTFTHFDC